MITVISLGGSIIVPDAVDEGFLAGFAALIESALAEDAGRTFIIVTGGGGTARRYQNSFYAITRAGTDAAGSSEAAASADWIGIMATRLNAELVRAIFHRHCPQEVVTDPTAVSLFQGRVLVAAGWKPGFSSDNDAVILAERFGANTIINLSNIEKVYTADPKLDPAARPLDAISWNDFRAMVGSEWTPGKNVPFDPVASKRANECGIRVICAAGRDLTNLSNILHNKPFKGTTIGA